MISLTKVNTGFDPAFNKYVIMRLIGQKSWSISIDDVQLDFDNPEMCSDTGMLLESFNSQFPDYVNRQNESLNAIADTIFGVVLQKQKRYKFEGIKLYRFLWNYYNRSSTGTAHIDYDSDNYVSIIYYLNTSDAFTIVGDTSVDCVEGQSIMFNSKTLHRGTSLIQSKFKFALNIMFSYDLVREL